MTVAEDTGIVDLEGNTTQADGIMHEPVKVWVVCTEYATGPYENRPQPSASWFTSSAPAATTL